MFKIIFSRQNKYKLAQTWLDTQKLREEKKLIVQSKVDLGVLTEDEHDEQEATIFVYNPTLAHLPADQALL